VNGVALVVINHANIAIFLKALSWKMKMAIPRHLTLLFLNSFVYITTSFIQHW